jgi:fatty-acyl-CoA synthase
LISSSKERALTQKHIEFAAQLPLTGVGKIDKKKLRASLWDGRERMVG